METTNYETFNAEIKRRRSSGVRVESNPWYIFYAVAGAFLYAVMACILAGLGSTGIRSLYPLCFGFLVPLVVYKFITYLCDPDKEDYCSKERSPYYDRLYESLNWE